MSLMRFVIWGHPRPQYGARRASQVAFGLFSLSLRGFVICPTQPFLNTPTPLLLETVLFLLWGVSVVRFSFSVRSRSSVRRVSVPFRRVVGLALSRGCCSWLLRPSSRSFSGSVVWCGFASRSRAAAFALVVSRLVGCVVWVRPGVCSVSGSVWFVSVPVLR